MKPVNASLLNKYFKSTEDPSRADCAIVFISSPAGGSGYDGADTLKGGNGYVPITLQYGEYKATYARTHSIAAGDPSEPKVHDRTYKDKTTTAANYNDLKTVLETKAAMKGKPVIVILTMTKPTIPVEFEKDANAIVANFGVQNQAILDVLTGAYEPSGLLPFQMPANMKTVELQDEDIPHDMMPYTDADHHTYDFGFGMNWKAIIHDARTEKYVDIVKRPAIHLQNLKVSISCATPGTKIYYSTDDSTPSFTEGHEYTKPFTIKKGAMEKTV